MSTCLESHVKRAIYYIIDAITAIKISGLGHPICFFKTTYSSGRWAMYLKSVWRRRGYGRIIGWLRVWDMAVESRGEAFAARRPAC
jgi:hypothetical protein